MGDVLFWVVVIGIFIFNILNKKEEDGKKKSVWQDFFSDLDKLEEPQKPAKPLKPQRKSKPHKESSNPFLVTTRQKPIADSSRIDFESYESAPTEVRTTSAMADLVPIWEAAGRGKYEIVQQKIAVGANVNEPDTFFGETALHRAAKAGDLEMVRILLEANANVYAVDQYAETPLHFAIRGRNPEVVRLLLEYGADPASKDIFGRTPVHCARFYENLRECFTL